MVGVNKMCKRPASVPRRAHQSDPTVPLTIQETFHTLHGLWWLGVALVIKDWGSSWKKKVETPGPSPDSLATESSPVRSKRIIKPISKDRDKLEEGKSQQRDTSNFVHTCRLREMTWKRRRPTFTLPKHLVMSRRPTGSLRSLKNTAWRTGYRICLWSKSTEIDTRRSKFIIVFFCYFFLIITLFIFYFLLCMYCSFLIIKFFFSVQLFYIYYLFFIPGILFVLLE